MGRRPLSSVTRSPRAAAPATGRAAAPTDAAGDAARRLLSLNAGLAVPVALASACSSAGPWHQGAERTPQIKEVICVLRRGRSRHGFAVSVRPVSPSVKRRCDGRGRRREPTKET